jgi:hypothetical protein
MPGMDIHFELNGDLFVWNDEKADTNWRKHGVRFEEAAMVFEDPFCSCWWMLLATMKREMLLSGLMRLDACSMSYISSLRRRVFESFPPDALNQKRS